MTEPIFLKWLMSLEVKPGAPTWMILDLYSVHRSAAVVAKMKSMGLSPFFIPGGCTSLLQFHDVSVMRPFKANLELMYGKAVVDDPGVVVQRSVVVDGCWPGRVSLTLL